MGSQPPLKKIFSKSGELTSVQPPPHPKFRGGLRPPQPPPLFGAPVAVYINKAESILQSYGKLAVIDNRIPTQDGNFVFNQP